MIDFVLDEKPKKNKVTLFMKRIKESFCSFIESMAVGQDYFLMRESYFFGYFLLILLLLSVFTGCSKEKTVQLTELKLSSVLSSNYSPVICITVEDGLAEKYGVLPKIQFDDNFEPLMTGKIDGKLNNLANPLISGANGADIIIFAGTMSGGHFVFANKNIAEQLKDPKNWKGHSLAMRTRVTSQLVLSAVLKEKYGYTRDEVAFKIFESDNAAISACMKGEVEIAPVSYGMRDTAVAQGLVQIGKLVDYYPDYACCRQTAYGPKFRSDRKLYVSWLKGLIQAWKIYSNNQEEAVRVVQHVTRQDKDWAYNHIYNKEQTADVSFNPDPFYNGVLSQYAICIEHGYINEKHRELQEYFDISAYADALREVIKENQDDQFYKDMWTYFVEHNNKYPDFDKNYPKKI